MWKTDTYFQLEQNLVIYLQQVSHINFDLSPRDWRKLAYEPGEAIKLVMPQNWISNEIWFFGYKWFNFNIFVYFLCVYIYFFLYYCVPTFIAWCEKKLMHLGYYIFLYQIEFLYSVAAHDRGAACFFPPESLL